MSQKQISTIFTAMLLLLSTIPAAVPHGIILDQGTQTAALVGDVFANVDEEIYVQYLGDVNARIHYIYYDNECVEASNDAIDVTPLQIVQIPEPVDENRKLVVLVEDTSGTSLLNQPLAGTVYVNGRTAVKNIPGLTATSTQGSTISASGTFNADGESYDVFPLNFIHLPFLTNGTNSPSVFNSLAINVFDANPQQIGTITFNDAEDPASKILNDVDCAGLTNIAIPDLLFTDIGGSGIQQGIPPGVPITDAGAGVIMSDRTDGRLLVESVFSDGEDADALSNVFYTGDGESASLTFLTLPPLSAAPQGIFTGKNENYQNPRLTSALASIGMQKPIESQLNDNQEPTAPSNFNIDTVFAFFNNGPARTAKARFDFISLDSKAFNECNHKDFSIEFTESDVEYFRVSQLLGANLLPGDSPIIGVLTVWDPEKGETLAGYRWDVIMETQPACNDGVDNDNDGTTDLGDIDCVPDINGDVGNDDSEDDGGVFTDRVDEINTVLDQEVMLTLNANFENGIASFEAAEHATTYVPSLNVFAPDDFNLVYVNWDALDDPAALDQVLDFQITDQSENTKSIRIPTTECITLLDKQSFPGLSDGSTFGTNPDVISYTGKFDQPNRGLAAFLLYNRKGIFATESIDDAADLAFTNNHHDGEIFADINVMPGSVPGPGGTFVVEVGVTPSVTQNNVDVTARWFAAVPDGADPSKLVRGPLICEEEVNHDLAAGEAFAIKVACPIDPLSIDTFLEVESSPLSAMGRVSIFVPKTT